VLIELAAVFRASIGQNAQHVQCPVVQTTAALDRSVDQPR
jgi:hypothetical protein